MTRNRYGDIPPSGRQPAAAEDIQEHLLEYLQPKDTSVYDYNPLFSKLQVVYMRLSRASAYLRRKASNSPSSSASRMRRMRLVVEPEVVRHGEAHGQHLLRLEEVAQIGARIPAADRAGALGVNGALVALILGVLDVDNAAPGEEVAVAAVARGHDAVEEVHAARDASMMFPGVPTPIR